MPTNINDKLISWASEIDPETIRQAEKTARLPIVEGHVALMPDAHVGIGATVGSVIPTNGAIIPAAVGVDIGCGMVAAELDVTEDQLPDSLEPLLGRIERAIPAGVGRGHDEVGNGRPLAVGHQPGHGAVGRPGARRPSSSARSARGTTSSSSASTSGAGCGWCCTRAAVASATSSRRCTSRRPAAWPSSLELRLEDPDLAYFMEGTPEFEAYIADMLWAQDYATGQPRPDDGQRDARGVPRSSARARRRGASTAITTSPSVKCTTVASCGSPARARSGPTSATSVSSRARWARAATSWPARATPASWLSCSHGAGRRHSRTKAKKLFTTTDLAEQMVGKVVAVEPGRCAGRRDPGGVQGHRPGHGRPGRPGGGSAHAAPGPELQGHLRRSQVAQRTAPPGRVGRGGTTHAGEVLRARTLGPVCERSGFDPRRRPGLPDANTLITTRSFITLKGTPPIERFTSTHTVLKL